MDQRGVRLANPTAYLEAVLVAPGIFYAGFVVLRASPRAALRIVRPAPVIAGVLMFLAYALTLSALQLAPASAVSAVRETSVVIAVLLAAPLLREAVGAMRVAGAVIVTTGVAAVALG